MIRTNKKYTLIVLGMLILFSIILITRKDVKVIIKEVPANTDISRYEPEIVWPRTDDQKSGAGSGVAIDMNGDILYLHRAGYPFNNDELIPYPTVIRLDDQTNMIINEWGENLFKSPHGLAVDSDNNIWITDIKLNQIFKFSSDGKLLQTFGETYPIYLDLCLQIRNKLNQLTCTTNPYIFARPTDIMINEQGEFIVTDGYRNSRLVKFDATGQLIWEIDQLGNENGAFYLPHGLAMDQTGRLYVADRKNARIQVFSSNGEWLASWDQPELGRPYALEVSHDEFLYVVDGGDKLDALDTDSDKRSQIIKIDLNGNIIERWGSFGVNPGEMDLPHDIAVTKNGTVYVAEINNERLQSFTPKE